MAYLVIELFALYGIPGYRAVCAVWLPSCRGRALPRSHSGCSSLTSLAAWLWDQPVGNISKLCTCGKKKWSNRLIFCWKRQHDIKIIAQAAVCLVTLEFRCVKGRPYLGHDVCKVAHTWAIMCWRSPIPGPWCVEGGTYPGHDVFKVAHTWAMMCLRSPIPEPWCV